MELDDDVAVLERWLEALPSAAVYDSKIEGAASRQGYLDQICGISDPPVLMLAYLQDECDELGSFLTLAYAAPIGISTATLRSRVKLKIVDDRNSAIKLSRRSYLKFLKEQGDEYEGGRIYVLPANGKITLLESKAKVLHGDAPGLAIAFLPKSAELSQLILMQLEVARRQFFSEIARSREERIAHSLNSMVELLSTDPSTARICELTRLYCRSQSLALYELKGNSYVCIDYSSEKRNRKWPVPIPVSVACDLVEEHNILRSHTFGKRVPGQLSKIFKGDPWMIVPCLTDAVNVYDGLSTKFTQYLIVAIGKLDSSYLGNDYSRTDLNVAKSLAALLSNHLPYIDASTTYLELSNELEQRGLRGLDLKWIYELARPIIPGLKSIGVFPEFPSSEGAQFEPEDFLITDGTVYASEITDRGYGSCLATTRLDRSKLRCRVFKAATEYHSEQKIVVAFEYAVVQHVHMRLLDAVLEHLRSACQVVDFRAYSLGTQAQVRHVIRGSLSAAIANVELISQRVRLYSRMPTKMMKLFGTPTMITSFDDALLWLNEAYALADAPRYLLDGFSESSIRWSDVDPSELVSETLAINRGEIRRRALRVEVIISPEMKNRWISADREFLKIVIFNLIDNAVKYSFQDRRLTVELSFVKGNRWRFEVSNFGVPIDAEERERIFDPWVRSFRQYLATRRPGTGLGLAVSRRILEAHDRAAVLDFESEVISKKPLIAATTFFFELDVKGKGEASRQ